MEKFIRYGGDQNIPLYNCSGMPPSEWTQKFGEPQPIIGAISLSIGVIVELLYIPCILVLISKEFRKYSCFKIMFVLGIIDMGGVYVSSIATGFLLIEGAVFCTHSTFIYITGSLGLCCWCTSCMLCLILVFNRVLDLLRPDIAAIFFEGWRTWIVLFFALLYGGYFFVFSDTVAFTSKYHGWFFDPLIFPDNANEYSGWEHAYNNFIVVGVTVTLYAMFIIFLRDKLRKELSAGSATARAHKQIFIQSCVICMFTLNASIIYSIMQFINVPLWLIKFGHFTYQLDHSCPVFIYLFVNRTIRTDVLAKLKISKTKVKIESNSNQRISKFKQITPDATV